MRLAVVLALLLAATVPAAAQSSTAAPAPAGGAPSACAPRSAGLGAMGRASIVTFTGKVYGEHVCALVANLSFESFAAQVTAGPVDGATIVAALGSGTGASLSASDGGVLVVPTPAGGAADGAAVVGPFAIEPGGVLPTFANADEQPRVVLAYAGPRVLLIRTSPVALLDLFHVLREQPDLFGTDAAERAVILASGADATLSIRSDAGELGALPATAHVLSLMKRR